MATDHWTTLGTIGGESSARVDGAGRVSAPDGSWGFGWSIGAEDRWFHPEDTANVRQSCVENVPVVETRMRVPGGDIVHRTHALHVAGADGGSEWVVVEVENDSGVPVALAVTRPDPARLVLPRDPSDERTDTDELVFTLTHRASITFLIGIAGAVDQDPAVADLPPTAAVVSGWKTQLDRGARLVVPDERLQQAIDVSRAHLMVDASRSISPAVATCLDDLGLHGDARSVVARLVEFRFDKRRGSFGDLASNAAVVAAVGRHGLLAPDPDFAAAVVDRVAAGVQSLLDAVKPRRVRRRSATSTEVIAALADSVGVLEAAGESDAVTTVGEALSRLSPTRDEPATIDPWVVVDELMSAASPTWTWPNATGDDRSAGETVRFLRAVRDVLIGEDARGVRLLVQPGHRWLGLPVEVHDVPTRHGPVSYAVRWHGERPALLWELAGDGGEEVEITCGLDPTWTSREPVGETLLAAPVVAAVDGPAAGDSFG